VPGGDRQVACAHQLNAARVERRVLRSTPLLDAVRCDAVRCGAVRLATHAGAENSAQSCARRASAHGRARQHAALRTPWVSRRYDRVRARHAPQRSLRSTRAAPRRQCQRVRCPVPQGALGEAYLALALPAERVCPPIHPSMRARPPFQGRIGQAGSDGWAPLSAERAEALLQPSHSLLVRTCSRAGGSRHTHACMHTCSAHSRHPLARSCTPSSTRGHALLQRASAPALLRTHPLHCAWRACRSVWRMG
jgi:hypothetical protein